MNRQEYIFLALAIMFWAFGVHALLIFLTDISVNTIYGVTSMLLLIPGAVLLLAAFQSRILVSPKDPVET
ncbi:MAG: hypothetical protein ACFFE8_02510 [Candidatus Heimdallarchaeota archaeon]